MHVYKIRVMQNKKTVFKPERRLRSSTAIDIKRLVIGSIFMQLIFNWALWKLCGYNVRKPFKRQGNGGRRVYNVRIIDHFLARHQRLRSAKDPRSRKVVRSNRNHEYPFWTPKIKLRCLVSSLCFGRSIHGYFTEFRANVLHGSFDVAATSAEWSEKIGPSVENRFFSLDRGATLQKPKTRHTKTKSARTSGNWR